MDIVDRYVDHRDCNKDLRGDWQAVTVGSHVHMGTGHVLAYADLCQLMLACVCLRIYSTDQFSQNSWNLSAVSAVFEVEGGLCLQGLSCYSCSNCYTIPDTDQK